MTKIDELGPRLGVRVICEALGGRRRATTAGVDPGRRGNLAARVKGWGALRGVVRNAPEVVVVAPISRGALSVYQ